MDSEHVEQPALSSSTRNQLRQHVTFFGIWFVAAVLVLSPGVLAINQRLIGADNVDVWNHAWGYWYVTQALSNGQWPFHTELVGHPTGGSLYFIDTPAAFLMSPFTWAFGPAVSYNLMLILRLTLVAFGAQLFTKCLSGRGPHTWLAGLAMLTSPFLLCELTNGISEVCGLGAVAMLCWSMARTWKEPRWSNWALVGVFQGLATCATFYYGLITALLCVLFCVGWILHSLLRKEEQAPSTKRLVLGSIGAGVIAVCVASPHIFGFITSIEDAGSLVRRNPELNEQLIRHNAVDPQIYIRPGSFQSVNLLADYGEPFIHTAYLRWSLLLLAIWAIWKHRVTRIWAGLALISLMVGLGPYLWLNGDWVRLPNGAFISLPFDWLRSAFPQIAITHPLRLAAPAIILVSGIAAVAARALKPWQVIGLGALICCEGLFASATPWPLAHSDARIGTQYDRIATEDQRAILDLPAEAGTSMRTSQYFWYQTKHGRPIPYTPDVRLGSSRDFETFKYFMANNGLQEWPQALSDPAQLHIRKQYARVVVHPSFDAIKSARYIEVLTAAFGDPTEGDGKLWWDLPALTDADKPPPSSTQSAYTNQGDMDTQVVCSRPERSFRTLMEEGLSPEDESTLRNCGEPVLRLCRQQILSPDTTLSIIQFCLPEVLENPAEEDGFVLTHLFQHPKEEVRRHCLEQILKHPNRPRFERGPLEQIARKHPELRRQLLSLVSQ